MAAPLSFTREYSLRFPAPDVARGFMLLLIALANVGFWAQAVGPRLFDTQADGVLTLLRVGLVDHRAYPLFAMLFGFGLMTMVKRRRRAYVDHAVENLATQGYVQLAPNSDVSLAELFDRDATRTARRLLINRGLWMLLIGAMHGLFFPGDVIGTYALLCVIFAGTIARERYLAPVIAGSILVSLQMIGMAVLFAFAPEIAHSGAHLIFPLDYSLYGLAVHGLTWVAVTISGALGSFVMLSMGVGAYLATTTIVSHPHHYRSLLRGIAIGALLIGFLGGLPVGLIESEMMNMDVAWWMEPLNHLAGFIGALGWMALFVAYAGPAPMNGTLTGIRWALAAVGKRSMTSYLLQTAFFLAAFVPLGWYGARISELAGVAIALGTWVATVVLALILEYVGKQGPFERLLRLLVVKTTRPVPSSVFPENHAWVSPSGMIAAAPVPPVPMGQVPVEPEDEGRPFSMTD